MTEEEGNIFTKGLLAIEEVAKSFEAIGNALIDYHDCVNFYNNDFMVQRFCKRN